MKTTIKFSFSFSSNATDVIMKFQLLLGCAASGNVKFIAASEDVDGCWRELENNGLRWFDKV